MLDELTYAKEMLRRGGYTLFLCNEGKVTFSEERGIKPLLALAETSEWHGAFAADKIVGKAAAMLYSLMGVRAVYAEVMSEPAKEMLKRHGIRAECETLCGNIINRSGNGLCPMEQAVLELDDPKDSLDAIHKKIQQLSQKSH